MLDQEYKYITSIEGVRSGHPIIENTRIGVHDVVGLVLNGSSIDDAFRSFTSLTRAQIYECMAYYEDHKAEIDLLVAQQMANTKGLS